MDRTSERSQLEKRGQGHETILIVEDEPLMVRLLERFFLASDGEEAIRLL